MFLGLLIVRQPPQTIYLASMKAEIEQIEAQICKTHAASSNN